VTTTPERRSVIFEHVRHNVQFLITKSGKIRIHNTDNHAIFTVHVNNLCAYGIAPFQSQQFNKPVNSFYITLYIAGMYDPKQVYFSDEATAREAFTIIDKFKNHE
jgi:hypothetical protein